MDLGEGLVIAQDLKGLVGFWLDHLPLLVTLVRTITLINSPALRCQRLALGAVTNRLVPSSNPLQSGLSFRGPETLYKNDLDEDDPRRRFQVNPPILPIPLFCVDLLIRAEAMNMWPHCLAWMF